MRHAGAAAAVGLTVLALAGSAAAETSAEVRELAAAAASGDRGALVQLEAVREVDGQRVDLEHALRGTTGAERQARLRVLADAAEPSGSVADPAASAVEILSERRYRGSDVPRPLHGVLEWLGDRLRTLAGPLRRAYDAIPEPLRIALALLVVVAAAVLVAAIARQRAGRILDGVDRHPVGDRSPAELEAEAEDAERRGELERALRLRFCAGLARLSLARRIPPGEWTSGELRPLVAHPAFDRLALQLDTVVYGRRPPRPEDVVLAREAWHEVLQGRVR
jgi:hypothetical protein